MSILEQKLETGAGGAGSFRPFLFFGGAGYGFLALANNW
jgi:hypothetical protein